MLISTTTSKMKYTHKNYIHIIYSTTTVGKFNHIGCPKELRDFVFFLSYHINWERNVHQQIKLLKYLRLIYNGNYRARMTLFSFAPQSWVNWCV